MGLLGNDEVRKTKQEAQIAKNKAMIEKQKAKAAKAQAQAAASKAKAKRAEMGGNTHGFGFFRKKKAVAKPKNTSGKHKYVSARRSSRKSR